MRTHSDLERRLLQRWLQEQEYNEELRLLRVPFSSPGYHTTLKDIPFAHPTRESLGYAVALLDGGGEAELERACAILDRVIALQETDRSLPTYGLWSWFYEEPLGDMRPPDWNWADFCGKRLLLAMRKHEDRLPDALKERLRQAVFRACEAIIARNVGPGYTNIAIMGAFVTLIAGETYGQEAFAAYGRQRLQTFYEYTMRRGAFEEYNSPTYTMVALVELSDLYAWAQSPEMRTLAAKLLQLAWGSVAKHFHPATRQWGGPHARSYDTTLSPAVLSFLQIALQGRVAWLTEEELAYDPQWYGSPIGCPDEVVPWFTEPSVRTGAQVFYRNEAKGIEKIASFHQTETLSIGSVSRENMWNQRRNLLAYLSGEHGTSYVWLRCLHDGYDYAAAVFHSVQQENRVLFGIAFSTNGGDTHNSLDRIRGSIEAKDLRLRFEIGGDGGEAKVEQDLKGELYVTVGRHVLNIRPVFASLGEAAARWDWSREGDRLCVDCVFYSGENRTIDFESLCQAGAMAVCTFAEERVSCSFKLTLKEQAAYLECPAPSEGEPLRLNMRLKPDLMDTLLSAL